MSFFEFAFQLSGKEFFKYVFLIIFAPRSTKTMEWRMLRLLNKDRRVYELKPLRMQEDLRKVARKHSLDMAQKDYFEHVNLKGHSPADRLKISGITDVTSGENLAKIGGYANPTQFAEVGLMNSPGHRANILQPLYNVVGIGVIQSIQKVYYFTQNFAKRELIFVRPFPALLRFRKKLHMRGYALPRVHKIVFRLLNGLSEEILTETVVQIKNGEFNLDILFPKSGRYKLMFYVNLDGGENYELSNQFELNARYLFS